MQPDASAPTAAKSQPGRGRLWIVAVSYLLFFALLTYVVYQKRSAFAALGWDNAGGFLLVILLALATTVLRGALNRVSFSLKHRISLLVGIRLAVVNTLGNYLPLSGGLIAKGVLLARHYGIGYGFYAGVSLYTFLLSISANGLLGMVGSLFTGQSAWLSGALALVLLSGMFTLVPIPVGLQRQLRGLGGKLEYARTHFAGILAPLSGIILLLFLAAGLRLQFAFAVMDVEVAFLACLLINSATIFARLASFVPGAIGVREFLVATMAHLAGLDFQMTILVVGLDRLGEVIVNFALGGLLVGRDPFAAEPTKETGVAGPNRS
jgi:hypothetical protein